MGVLKEKEKVIDCEMGAMRVEYVKETRFPIYNSILDVPHQLDYLIEIGMSFIIFGLVVAIPMIPIAIKYPSGEAPLIPFLAIFVPGAIAGGVIGILLAGLASWMLYGDALFDFIPLPQR